MRLKVLSSSSAGNCYILENETEALIIEAGVPFKAIKRALGFNLRKAVGCLISHCHLDHAKSMEDVATAGINVYSLKETSDALNIVHHRVKNITPEQTFQVGKFKVQPFNLVHDVPIIGFYINHEETGNVAFITDSRFSPVTFRGLNNIIVEANYCQTILDSRVAAGENPQFLRDRVITSHMSLHTCKELLQANDLSRVNNIVLIHLSDGNSDAVRFKREVEETTGKRVFVAEAGLTIEFNTKPF